jgi:hypothetical protein
MDTGLRIKVIIFHHNEPENADRLYDQLSEVFKGVELWDSGSDCEKIPKNMTHSYGNIYGTGAWNEILKRYGDWDVVWLVCADIKLLSDVKSYKESIESAYPFGCWSPCVEGRAHPFMLAENYTGENAKMVYVKNVESQAMAMSGSLLREVKELLPGSKYGFGHDYWLCHRSRKMGLKNVIDGRVKIFHPFGTGYNEEEAEKQMEEAFGKVYGKDFRRSVFEYSSTFSGNLFYGNVIKEIKKEEEDHMLTIFTVDNGWGLVEFSKIVKGYDNVNKLLIKKGLSTFSSIPDIKVVEYSSDFSRYADGNFIALFPKVGPSNFEDFKEIVRLGIPTIVHVAYNKEVVDHEKTGYLYQDESWVHNWLKELIGNREMRCKNFKNDLSNFLEVQKKAGDALKEVAKGFSLVEEKKTEKVEEGILVSVITPTFRREPKVVRRCCNCVQLQTVSNWEQLVCSDGVEEPVIKEMIEGLGDKRIQYCHTNTKKPGDFGNTVRSEMLKKARGKYVIFMDDDNVILPEYLEKMINAIEKGKVDFGICQVVHFGPLNESEVGKAPQVLTGNPVKLYHIDSLQVMVRREAMLDVGWDTDSGYIADGVSLEALGKKYKPVHLNEILGFHL